MASLCSSKRLPHLSFLEAIHIRPTRAVIRKCFSTTPTISAASGLDQLDQTKGNRQRVVILGSGWAGHVLSRLLPHHQILVISPRNYFVFTPLLSSAATGTLEFRLALEPVRSPRYPNVEFYQAWADGVSTNRKTVTVEESVVDQRRTGARGGGGVGDGGADPYRHSSLTALKLEKFGKRREGKRFEVSYDKLVIAVGCYSQTFNTPGVKENAYFMKDVGDARRVRKRVLECFEMATLPSTPQKLRQQLLNFAIVGGGPTGMEFAAELSDLVTKDVGRMYPNLRELVRITVHDVAPKILSMFDEKLAGYAMGVFQRRGVGIKTRSSILELRSGPPRGSGGGNVGGSEEEIADAQGVYTLVSKNGDGVKEEGVGMCVWSTGNMRNPFIKRELRKTRRFPYASAVLERGSQVPEELGAQDWLWEAHPRTGALVVDEWLRVKMRSQTMVGGRVDGNGQEGNGGKEGEEETPAARAALTDVFALGDNAAIEGVNLPATAQTASQQATYLAKVLNDSLTTNPTESSDAVRAKAGTATPKAIVEDPTTSSVKKFKFRNLGIMAYVGDSRAILDTGKEGRGWNGKDGKGGIKTPDISGRAAWLVWRGAYMAKSLSWRNRVLIPMYWFLNWLFGRDITRF